MKCPSSYMWTEAFNIRHNYTPTHKTRTQNYTQKATLTKLRDVTIDPAMRGELWRPKITALFFHWKFQ